MMRLLNKSKIFLTTIILSTSVLFNASVFAVEKDCNHPAVVTVKGMVDEILEDLKGQLKKDGKIDKKDVNALINSKLVPKADLNTTAALVLANHWKRLNPQQQARFIDEFSKQMIRTYGVAFEAYDGETVDFDCRVKKLPGKVVERVEVGSKINHNKAPSNQVGFRLLNKNNNWYVYDLIIDNISIGNSYRTVYLPKFSSARTPAQINQRLDQMKSTKVSR